MRLRLLILCGFLGCKTTAIAHTWFEPFPQDYLSVKWDLDPTLLIFIMMLVLYRRGISRFVGRSPVAFWQKALFYSGVSIIILALVPPIDPLADQLFWVHMVQHMMISILGVPMIICGAPMFVILRALPPFFLRTIYRPLMKNKKRIRFLRFMAHPIITLAIFQSVVWMWHIPYLYNLALFNDFFHMLEHGSFAATSMLLWRNLISPRPMRPWMSVPSKLLLVSAMMILEVPLSAYLTFIESPIYGYEGIPSPTWWTWGHLQDQRLGGLIMWVPGEFIHLVALAIIFFSWVRIEAEKDDHRLLAG